MLPRTRIRSHPEVVGTQSLHNMPVHLCNCHWQQHTLALAHTRIRSHPEVVCTQSLHNMPVHLCNCHWQQHTLALAHTWIRSHPEVVCTQSLHNMPVHLCNCHWQGRIVAISAHISNHRRCCRCHNKAVVDNQHTVPHNCRPEECMPRTCLESTDCCHNTSAADIQHRLGHSFLPPARNLVDIQHRVDQHCSCKPAKHTLHRLQFPPNTNVEGTTMQ